MNILFNDYIKKLVACYKGKAIGGTLGMPFEGKTETNNIEFYDPIPKTMQGNDDLDLQVVWLETILKRGLPINSFHLAKAWKHLNFGPDEYGVAIHNLKNKLFPPLSGVYGNKFGGGMGAAIRSELWAALAPGNPELATSFAKIDSCVDHSGSGISGSVFLTAVESAAYKEQNILRLIETGLSFVKEDVRFYSAVKDTLKWWNELNSLFAVRDKIIEKYASDNWSDVTVNVCFIVLAWLAGNGDFGKTICYAVNCGYDTDCTAASVGAVLGIINPDCIEKRWADPIGDKLVLSRQILGVRTSENMTQLCNKIAALAFKCCDFYASDTRLTEVSDDIRGLSQSVPEWSKSFFAEMLKCNFENEGLFSVTPIAAKLIYPEIPDLAFGEEKEFTAQLLNPSNITAMVDLKLTVPECFSIDQNTFSFSLEPFGEKKIKFRLKSLTDYKSAFDSIVFSFKINGMQYVTEAGIICSYPWVEKECGADTDDIDSFEAFVYSPAPGFIKKIEAGARSLAIEVRPAMALNAAFTCQGTRPITVWLNGKKILEYSGKAYVPGLHRGQSVLADLKADWNKIVLQIADGDEGEVFFAIGNPVDWIWLNTLEWRKFREESKCQGQ